MARNVQYHGLHQTEDDGWKHLGDLSDDEGNAWAVYQGRVNQKGWSNIKVAVYGKAKAKGNYWVAWSGERLARSSEAAKMADARPKLYDGLVTMLQQAEGLDLI